MSRPRKEPTTMNGTCSCGDAATHMLFWTKTSTGGNGPRAGSTTECHSRPFCSSDADREARALLASGIDQVEGRRI
jgi:hypothetical protein